MDDVTKQVLIDVQLKSDDLKSALPQLLSDIDAITQQQKELTKAGQKGTEEFAQNAQILRKLSAEYRNTNKEIDNTSKALNAENNSIQQNRALLSVLTNQYIKLGQEEGKTAASTVALGKTINNLTTKLKEQEKQIGQTYRNVCNYADAFKNASSAIGVVSPKLAGFANGITAAAKAFNIMGSASKEAATGEAAIGTASEGATEGVVATTGAITGMIIAIVAVIAGIAAVIGWFAKLTPNAEALKREVSGVGGAFNAFMSDIGKGVGFGQLFDDMAKAYQQAKELTGAMQDLSRATEVLAVNNANADAKIADLQLKMRNRRNTAAQEQAYFNQIQSISTQSYNERKKIADAEYDLAVRAATIGRKFTDDEIAQVREKGVAYAAYLDKIKGLANKGGAGTDVANIAKAQEDQAAAERFNETVKDRAQNRLDAQQLKNEAAAQKDLDKQNEIKRQIEEINSERIASMTKMLEFEQESFGKEISSTDEHYRQLIFKQQQFIEKQKAIQANPKSSAKTKSLAGQAIGASQADISQLQKERYSESEKLLIEHNRNIIEMTEKAALDLKAIQIQGIKDNQKREIAGINNEFQQKLLAYKDQNQTYQDTINKLNEEIKAKQKQVNKNPNDIIAGNELQALKTALNGEEQLLENNGDLVIAAEKAKQKAIQDTNDKYESQKAIQQDQINILQNAGPNKSNLANPFSGASAKDENLQIQLVKDQETAELQQAGITETQKQLIVAESQEKINQIVKENAEKRKDIELQSAEIVQGDVFSIISNAIKSSGQAKEVQLSKDKTNELNNTSLTSAQKAAVNNKYRILEGQAKVKEFKADQKLSEAKIVISTAEAIAKASPNPILIAFAAATGAAELAVAIAQKPPAYATGGYHKSDGKGALLSGYSRKDNVNATLRSGEAVVVSEAMQNPYARNLVSAINVAYGGRDFSVPNVSQAYEVGGIVTDGNNSNRYYAQPQEGTENLANTIAYSLINNFPPVQVQVRDINSQQSILAKTIDRVTI